MPERTNFGGQTAISMRIYLCTIFLILITFPAVGQYCNEWISESGYDKTYFRFPIDKDGLYRITASTLEQEGFDMAHYEDIKMYAKGRQVPIYLASDYIEFVGYGNDGEMDTALFLEPDWQVSDEQTLFTDVLFYYLTWDANGDHLRYNETENDLSSAAEAEPFFMHRSSWWAANIYHSGVPFRIGNVNVTYSAFDEGEGFWSPFVDSNLIDSASSILSTPSVYDGPGAPLPLLETKIAGRSNELAIIPDHHAQITVGEDLLLDFTFDGFKINEYEIEVPISSLNTLSSSQTKVTYTAVGDIQDGASDRFSYAYTHITYARQFDFGGESGFAFSLDNDSDKYIAISNFDGGLAPVLYDMTNMRRYEPVFETGLYKFQLQANPDNGEKMDLFFVSTNGFLNPEFDMVNSLEPIEFTDFSQLENQGQYIILYHKNLTTEIGGVNQIEAYAEYRASEAGGAYAVQALDIERLYDAFSWGVDKHPLSIRNFVNYALASWSIEPEYLLLIGKSINYRKCRYSPTTYQQNLLPTFGNPASDPLLTSSGSDSYRSQLATGRISARTPEQVKNYLDKVMVHEARARESNCDDLSARAASRRAVHLSSSYNQDDDVDGESDDFVLFTSMLRAYENYIENDTFRGEVIDSFHYIKPVFTGGVGGSDPGPDRYQTFKDILAEGVSVVNFVGHGNSDAYPTWDYSSSWYFQASNFDIDYYPIIFSGSCFVGAVHSANETTMAEDWTLSPNRGAVGFLGGVRFGYSSYLAAYMQSMHKHFSSDLYGMSMGKCMLAATDDNYFDLQVGGSAFALGMRKTIEEYTWCGDPAIRLTSYQNPEYYFPDGDGSVQLSGLEPNVSEITVAFTLANYGNLDANPLPVQISIQVEEQNFDQVFLLEDVVAPANQSSYEFIIDVSNLPEGLATLTVQLDPGIQLQEDCIINNVASQTFEYEVWQCPTSAEPLEAMSICSGEIPVLPISDFQAAIVDEDSLALGGSEPIISWYWDAALTEVYDESPFVGGGTAACPGESAQLYAAISCSIDSILIPAGSLDVTVYPPLYAPTIIRIDEQCNYEVLLTCPDEQFLLDESFSLQLEPEDPAGTVQLIVQNSQACQQEFTVEYEACPGPPPPTCPSFVGVAETSLMVCAGALFTLSLEAVNPELGEVAWLFPENHIEYGYQAGELFIDPPLGCSQVVPVVAQLTCLESGAVIHSEQISIEAFGQPIMEANTDGCFVSVSSNCEDHLISWIDSDGNEGIGNTYEFEPGCEGDVRFSAQSANSQVDCGTADILIDCDCDFPLSTQDQQHAGQVQISPNPNTGQFMIKFPAHWSPDNTSLVVFDALGRRLAIDYQTEDSMILVKLPTFSQGLYFLQAKEIGINQRITRKLLVE